MQCILCASHDIKILREKVRYDIPRKVFSCQGCSLVFLDSNHKDLEEYYQKEYRTLHSPVLGKELTVQEFFDLNMPMQRGRVKKVKHLLRPEMRVLDIGSSAGMFLHELKPYVQERIGVEFDKTYAMFAEKELGIRTYTSPLTETDLEPQSFDMISALEVLEHVKDPAAFLADMKRYLKPDGFVYIEVPNHDDSLLSVFNVPGYRDFYYRVPHTFYYNPKTLRMFLERAGLYGDVSAAQGYEPNVLNQLNWMLTNNPQPTVTLAYGRPQLPYASHADEFVRKEFDTLLTKWDEEHHALRAKHLCCSHVVFIGRLAHSAFI